MQAPALAVSAAASLAYAPMTAFPPLNEQMDAIRRGAAEIIPEEALARKIERAIRTGEPLIVKQGFDPTRPDLHVGHMVSIRKLRRSGLGHRVVFLIGDARWSGTSGQTEPPTAPKEVRRHRIYRRVFRYWIGTPSSTEQPLARRAALWTARTAPRSDVSLASHAVARLLERDGFINPDRTPSHLSSPRCQG
jgi:tyrosyl-tRNA synthetase